MIRRALRHESIHVAQECNNSNLINPRTKKNEIISTLKANALKGSIALTGEKEKEYEAYSMEDQPRQIIRALKKYCITPLENKSKVSFKL